MEEHPQAPEQESNDKLTSLIYQIAVYLACAGIGGSLVAIISTNVQLAKIQEQIVGIREHIEDIDLQAKRIYTADQAEKDLRIRDERINRLEKRLDDLQPRK